MYCFSGGGGVSGGVNFLCLGHFLSLDAFSIYISTPVFDSPAKQKRDICTAFPASASSAA